MMRISVVKCRVGELTSFGADDAIGPDDESALEMVVVVVVVVDDDDDDDDDVVSINVDDGPAGALDVDDCDGDCFFRLYN
jgi:hypothetical protein